MTVGRSFWASISDYIGRKATKICLFSLGAILYLSIPYFASAVATNPAMIYLAIFSMYGGGFSTIPAYLADMFGTMHVGGF